MQTKIQKWGNSQGIRLPKKILEYTHIRIGEAVSISAVDGKIIIETVKEAHGKYDIKTLISQMPDNQLKAEIWGDPVGKEAW